MHIKQVLKQTPFAVFYPVSPIQTLHKLTSLQVSTRYLRQNGFVTSYASDYCGKDNTRTNHNLSRDQLYDHQLLLCDPNVINYNSIIKRCLYGKMNTYHLYEYTNQFWRKYANNRKYSLISVNDGHEGTLEVVKYTDEIIYNF